ncbi:MAG TPA: hypothetical protein VMN57_02580 [Anaerolineales bacterium]|nr:hypothetical protein [Anaerolineales bacterium]
MNDGMLWFDNDSGQSLVTKVDRAAEYYRRKYGRRPSLCFVHPTMLPTGDGKTMAGQVEVRTAPWVMPNHFFIGENGRDS